jgi:hypothetical protein
MIGCPFAAAHYAQSVCRMGRKGAAYVSIIYSARSHKSSKIILFCKRLLRCKETGFEPIRPICKQTLQRSGGSKNKPNSVSKKADRFCKFLNEFAGTKTPSRFTTA